MTQKQHAFLQIAERLGIPAATMVFMALMLWGMSFWLASNVVEPLMERHLRFLDATENTNREQTAAWKAITEIEQEQLMLLRELHRRSRQNK